MFEDELFLSWSVGCYWRRCESFLSGWERKAASRDRWGVSVYSVTKTTVAPSTGCLGCIRLLIVESEEERKEKKWPAAISSCGGRAECRVRRFRLGLLSGEHPELSSRGHWGSLSHNNNKYYMQKRRKTWKAEFHRLTGGKIPKSNGFSFARLW